MNALGIIYRDALLVNADPQKAYNYFQAAAGQDLAEAQVNLAKLHLGMSRLATNRANLLQTENTYLKQCNISNRP